eukprot:3884643-Rhodomonas_salina.1
MMETIPDSLSRRCLLARAPGGNSMIPDCSLTSVSDSKMDCDLSVLPQTDSVRALIQLVAGLWKEA